MAEFKLDRIKFRWKGNWANGLDYIKDDIIYYDGKAFVCLQRHESSDDFYLDRYATNVDESFIVTVNIDTINGDSHGRFYLDGLENPELNLLKGRTYTFVQADSSNLEFDNEVNPLLFSITFNGELAGGPRYNTNVVYLLDDTEVSADQYVSNFADATNRSVRITIPQSAPDRLFYYSPNNPNMGGVLNTRYESNWELMFDGQVWKDNWAISTFYSEGDIVKYNGYLYQCIESHTSSLIDNLGLDADIEKWIIYATTYNWRNIWEPSIDYDLGDVVRYNGVTYICIAKHVSSSLLNGLEANQLSWQIVTRSDNWKSDWNPNSRYTVDDIVKYGGITYRCIEGHNSATLISNGLEVDNDKWEIVISGVEYKGEWDIQIRYKENDIVKSGGGLWKSLTGHTSGITSLRSDGSNWEVYIPGLEFERSWDSLSEYQAGDIVLYGGYAYTALTNNIGSIPSVNGLVQDTGDWELLKQGYNHRGDWNPQTQYFTGDIIRNSGNLYIALQDNANIYPDTLMSTWQLIVDGNQWHAEWTDNTEYFIGDVVTYASTAYSCILRHTSSESDARPDLDILNPDQNYWVVLVQGSPNNVMIEKGDLRMYDTEPVRLPIGSPGKVLKSIDGVPSWETFDVVDNVFYVSVEGTDAAGFGTQLSAPFRTVKYACEHVASILNTEFIIDWNVITTVVNDIAIGGTLYNQSYPNLIALLTETKNGFLIADVDNDGLISTDDASFISQYGLGTLLAGDEFNWIQDNIEQRLLRNPSRFRQEDTFSSEPENATIFIKTGYYEEILPISIPKNTALAGDELRSTVITPAPSYEQSNMFYVRNGSGIRNMTLQGLYGDLGAPNEFLTRRPTAGAYVSLDPGTGPTDESVWIINKSPYIQNVTTFGTACIGMKIDGNLHEGGNRSIVANDFTQVLSDGIGYWADNNGLSELVSVFTYYCHIGYLTTNGGKLRATNGNNSYGTYGSVAEGFDQSEAPIEGLVNNRSFEAQVDEIFTFGTNEQRILATGYSHAGQEYSAAGTNITFTGSGLNAAGYFEEIRNDAISELRVTDPGDSSVAGGLNYTFVGNNAQFGDETSITLAQADIGTAENYVGQRIIIISGLGVGQYAEIAGFNPNTKQVILSRESNNTNGWDHFQPGWPIEPLLDGTTRYVIEPRVVAESPIFVSNGLTGPSGNGWEYITKGNIFVAISQGGVGTTTAAYSNDGSSWTTSDTGSSVITSGLTYTGSSYIASIFSDNSANPVDYLLSTNDGNSWSTITLPFSDNWNGIASSKTGEMVVLGASGNVAYSTDNGSNWLSSSLGISSGETWTKLAYGNGKFVVLDSSSNRKVAYSTNNGATWTVVSNTIPENQWTDVIYGNGRFVAISDPNTDSTFGFARTMISFDGITWREGVIENGEYDRISYGVGVFIATGPGNTIAKSQDGLNWRTFDEDSTAYTLPLTGVWTGSVYDPNNQRWIAMNSDNNSWSSIETGARAIIRAKVSNSRITEFSIYDPGSNYTSTPEITVVDNQNTIDTRFTVRMNNGVLAQPEMSNRGQGYFTASASITGDGFADIFQTGQFLVLSNITRIPGPGDNLNINGIDDEQYSVVDVVNQSGAGPYNITIQITPRLDRDESPTHNTGIEIRQRYSQIRLTGHDFLDIGTGNALSTRYPFLYLEGEEAENARQPFNETVAVGGGRVFYTSTDQDGNFRVGELFEVEQSTGIVTVNASQFDLSGLTELVLGGIQVGGSAVVIQEFSKDGTMIANSNNVVPTQAAIIKFVGSRISGGGANASTNTLISGQIRITANEISTTSDLQVNFKTKGNMLGGIDGHYLASMYFTAFGR